MEQNKITGFFRSKPVGLLLPCWWSAARCKIATPTMQMAEGSAENKTGSVWGYQR